jgi:nitrate reductase beta subunit
VKAIRRLVESIKEKKAAEESATKLQDDVKKLITRLRYAEVTGVNERGVEDCCISFKPFYRNDTVVLITGCECGKCMLHSDEGEKVIVDIKQGKTKKCFLCNTKISGFIRTTVANSATDRVWEEIQTLLDLETVDQVKERHEEKIEQDGKDKTNQILSILRQR